MENFFYKIKRLRELSRITGTLGKVVEDEEKITCYVNKDRGVRSSSFDYYLIKPENHYNKAYLKYLNLDKPVYYVFENIEFENPLLLGGDSNVEIIFKNCKINKGIDILNEINCKLENSILTIDNSSFVSIKKLTIDNLSLNIAKNGLFLRLRANTIDISNTNIKTENANLSLEASTKINISNSTIDANIVSCSSNAILMDNKSTLKADTGIKIQVNNYNQINVDSKNVYFNEKRLFIKLKDTKNEVKRVTLKKADNPLSQKRHELIKVLKKVKNRYESINKEKVEDYTNKMYAKLNNYQEEVNNTPVGKIK